MEALRPPIRDDDHMVILLPTLRGSAPADGVSAPKPGDTHQGAACSRLHGKAAERADTPRIAQLAQRLEAQRQVDLRRASGHVSREPMTVMVRPQIGTL
jgi:hypothetical protein